VDVRIFKRPEDAAIALAHCVAAALQHKRDIVLGLPTGRSPVAAYAELRRQSADGKVDFSAATTFNLDEFVGIDGTHPGSFRQFMEAHLFSGIPIDRSRVHFLDGVARDLEAECDRYEHEIEAAGGIDLMLLGIGANGHIGFNEPGRALVARTHRVRLHTVTRRENAALFGGDIDDVPRDALSMGMATILHARRIVLIATGVRKARCIERAVRGPLTPRMPASFLQVHPHVELFLDEAAASMVRAAPRSD
jgi:glucosamine-6-phosphate deaminase